MLISLIISTISATHHCPHSRKNTRPGTIEWDSVPEGGFLGGTGTKKRSVVPGDGKMGGQVRKGA